MKYSFHPLARKEFDEAIEYYNKCQNSLGIEFAREVYNSIHLILQFSKAWPPFSKNTRRCITNRFPYGVIYQKSEDEIIIIAIMQLNKEPSYWYDRV